MESLANSSRLDTDEGRALISIGEAVVSGRQVDPHSRVEGALWIQTSLPLLPPVDSFVHGLVSIHVKAAMDAAGLFLEPELGALLGLHLVRRLRAALEGQFFRPL